MSEWVRGAPGARLTRSDELAGTEETPSLGETDLRTEPRGETEVELPIEAGRPDPVRPAGALQAETALDTGGEPGGQASSEATRATHGTRAAVPTIVMAGAGTPWAGPGMIFSGEKGSVKFEIWRTRVEMHILDKIEERRLLGRPFSAEDELRQLEPFLDEGPLRWFQHAKKAVLEDREEESPQEAAAYRKAELQYQMAVIDWEELPEEERVTRGKPERPRRAGEVKADPFRRAMKVMGQKWKMDTHQIRDELASLRRREGEMIESLRFRMEALLEQTGTSLTDRERQTKFLNALDADLEEQVQGAIGQARTLLGAKITLKDVVGYAESLEAERKEKVRRVGEAQKVLHSAQYMLQREGRGKRVTAAQADGGGEGTSAGVGAGLQYGYAAEGGRRPTSGLCFICQRPGHYAKDCTAKPKGIVGGRGRLVCIIHPASGNHTTAECNAAKSLPPEELRRRQLLAQSGVRGNMPAGVGNAGLRPQATNAQLSAMMATLTELTQSQKELRSQVAAQQQQGVLSSQARQVPPAALVPPRAADLEQLRDFHSDNYHAELYMDAAVGEGGQPGGRQGRAGKGIPPQAADHGREGRPPTGQVQRNLPASFHLMDVPPPQVVYRQPPAGLAAHDPQTTHFRAGGEQEEHSWNTQPEDGGQGAMDNVETGVYLCDVLQGVRQAPKISQVLRVAYREQLRREGVPGDAAAYFSSAVEWPGQMRRTAGPVSRSFQEVQQVTALDLGVAALPAVPPSQRKEASRYVSAITLDVRAAGFRIGGVLPGRTVVDTGAQCVIISPGLAARLGLVGDLVDHEAVRLNTANGREESPLARSKGLVPVVLNQGTPWEVCVMVRVVISTAAHYDVLLGMAFLFPIGGEVDAWTSMLRYRVDWQGSGRQLAQVPINTMDVDSDNPGAAMLAYSVDLVTSGSELLEGNCSAEQDGGAPDLPELEVVAACRDRRPWRTLAQGGAALAAAGLRAEAIKQLAAAKPLAAQQTWPSVEPPLTVRQWARPIDQRVVKLEVPPEGATVLELFAGLGTGLAGLLANGVQVARYIYVEPDKAAREAHAAHISILRAAYPQLLPAEALQGAGSWSPRDIRRLSPRLLEEIGGVDYVVAGWECQGHSRAGVGRGLADPRSGLFYELVRVLNQLQALNPRPFGYLLENVQSGDHPSEVVRTDFAVVQSYIGCAINVDAVAVGSYAHRLRSFWTNLLPASLFAAAVKMIKRPAGLQLTDILEDYHLPRPVVKADLPPFYCCNVPGRDREVLPTLVAFKGSYAFRDGGPGMVLNIDTGKLEEPNAEERERAMGFINGASAGESLTDQQRCEVLGRAMDLRCLTWIMSLAITYQTANADPFPTNGACPTSFNSDCPTVSLASRADMQVSQGGRAGAGVEAGVEVATAEEKGGQAAAPSWKLGGQLEKGQKEALQALLEKQRGNFAFSSKELGTCTAGEATIDMVEDNPVFRPKHRLSVAEWEMAQEKIEELVAQGLVEPSESQYAAPIVMVAKKDADGNWGDRRLCGDYRALNEKTLPDHYTMPTPDDIFDAIGRATYFSKLDLRSGFHQVPIAEKDRHKTAFWGKQGLYQWRVMPFGLRNAPTRFQRMMDQVLAKLESVRCFVDDVLVFSCSFEEHLQHLDALFEKLRAAGLKCHPAKCEFGAQEVEYLGHKVTPQGVEPQQAKAEAIAKMQAPRDVSELRSVLGLFNYYRRFVDRFSEIAHPLTKLTQESQAWQWEEEQQLAFGQLKQALTTAPVLRRPDFKLPFILYTDWSKVGLGAVLAQMGSDGEEHAVAFASRSNNKAERNYGSSEGECLAVVWATLHFRPYLYGRRYTIVTDHAPLKWLMQNDKLTGKLARWSLMLQEYEFEVIHRAGTANGNADALSRSPLEGSGDRTGARMDYEDAEREAGRVSELLAFAGEEDVEQVQRDIWLDQDCLAWLQLGTLPAEAGPSERDRNPAPLQAVSVGAGAAPHHSRWGDSRVVPPPARRAALVRNVHQQLGHFGVARTCHLVSASYWWRGLKGEVKEAVRRCQQCDRVKTVLTARGPVLHPLPIMGLFYRWSCDLAGELPPSRRGHRYILVAIEHFSKWVEIVPLMSKHSTEVRDAFLLHVISRFGAPAEVLTDQGTEFRGAFDQLLQESMIDHRVTARDHPQSDGLAERMVQTLKRGLRKYCLAEDVHDWDLKLPYLVMGYRLSKQKALSCFSPYFLLFGRGPVLPGGLRAVLNTVVSWEDDDQCLEMLKERGMLIRAAMPIAMQNLAIAQHRDRKRYAAVRGGTYVPRVCRFMAGDYVYVQRPIIDTLDTAVHPHILRVAAVEGATLRLLGSDGRAVTENQENCSPCHLPHINDAADPILGFVRRAGRAPAGARANA